MNEAKQVESRATLDALVALIFYPIILITFNYLILFNSD